MLRSALFMVPSTCRLFGSRRFSKEWLSEIVGQAKLTRGFWVWLEQIDRFPEDFP